MYIQFYSCTVSNFSNPMYGTHIPAHYPSVYEEGPFWSHELHGVSLCISIQLEND